MVSPQFVVETVTYYLEGFAQNTVADEARSDQVVTLHHVRVTLPKSFSFINIGADGIRLYRYTS